MNKKRKSLNDALAQQFVFGSQPEPEPEPIREASPQEIPSPEVEPESEPSPEPSPEVELEPSPEVELEPSPEPEPQPKVQKKPKTQTKTKKKELNVNDRLQPVEREATVRITVDLPESLHKRLSIYCATSGNKKAEVVRVLLDEYLSQQGVKDD